jgi:mono/diheme cytochrome c family protein/glucose/arabinose dehydrogenase
MIRALVALAALLVLAIFAARYARPSVVASSKTAPVFAPDAALDDFTLADPNLRLELVAADPLLVAPVAMRFDEDGRLWVVEMPSYMTNTEGAGEHNPINRVSFLEDKNTDGFFESRTVFIDHLVLPRGVLPTHQTDGRPAALVIAPPSVLFARDTDGDGRADSVREVLAGISGLDNPEHAPNGLLVGLDNWIEFSQHSIAFRWIPGAERVETRSNPSHGQWGLTMDDLGRVYYTPNSEALRVDLIPKWFATRFGGNALAGVNEPVMDTQRVWPERPNPGVNRAYQPGTLADDGRLASHTAACAPTIDRAGLIGPLGNAYVCEPAGNLVRRISLLEERGRVRGVNAFREREFMTSPDERFRPVATCMGPDGALYIADMYRGVIQHKNYLTPYLKDQIRQRGLDQHVGLGRLWRVVPKDKPLRSLPRLSAATTDDLVAILADANGWWRDTAQRLLVERADPAGVEPLRILLSSGSTDLARTHALWTLEGMGVLSSADLAFALADTSANVRMNALRALAPKPAEHAPAIQTLLDEDQDPDVRRMAVLALGSVRGFNAKSGPRLLALALAADDPVLRACIVNTLSGSEIEALRRLIPADTPRARTLAADLSSAILRADRILDRAVLMDLLLPVREGSGIGSDLSFSESTRNAILSRIESAMNLTSPRPRPLVVGREPEAFTAAARSDNRLARIATWLDWPGRVTPDRGSKPPPLTADQQASFDRGNVLFTRSCAGCHGTEGRGVPGQTPPLAGSPRATGPVSRAARIVLHGLEGSFERDGVVYNGQMPSPGMSDTELADILTYVRRSWGNGSSPVSGSEVLRVRMNTVGRTRMWTVGEIDGLED